MRSSKSRSRNKSNRQRTLGNVVNRVFDSSGPEGKVRGTPQQIIEKYLALARDAQLSNDRVAEQSFFQHAEHYTRMLGEALREQAERQQQQGYAGNGNGGQHRDDDADAPQQHNQQRRDDDRGERHDRDRGERDRQDRGDRNDRNRQPRRDDQPRRDEQPRRDDVARTADSRTHGARPEESRQPDAVHTDAPTGELPWQGWAARNAASSETFEAGLPDAVDTDEDRGPVALPEDQPAPVPATAEAAVDGDAAPAPRRAPRAAAAPRRTRKPAPASDTPPAGQVASE